MKTSDIAQPLSSGFAEGEQKIAVEDASTPTLPSEATTTIDGWGLNDLHERMSTRGALTKRILQMRTMNRLLLLAIASVLFYLVIGGIFCMVMMKYDFTNTIYFLVTSMLTIGYGDYAPDDPGERVIMAFLLLFAVGGIGVWVGFAINIFFTQGDRGLEKRIAQYRDEESSSAEGCALSPIHEYEIKRKVMILQLKMAVTLWLCLTFLGTVVFVVLEDTTVANGFYWVINTCTTTGYGNVTPTHTSTKWFTVFFSVISTVVLLWTFGMLGTYPLRLHQWQQEKEVLLQYGEEITEEQFDQIVSHTVASLGQLLTSPRKASSKAETAARARLNRPDSGRAPSASFGGGGGGGGGGRFGPCVTKADFVLSMLLMLDRVSEQDLRECTLVFDKMDKNGYGVLYRDDVARPRSGRQEHNFA